MEGKIKAIEYIRTHGIPYFGICYGMQLALIEYARTVLGYADAHTTEVNKKTPYPVVDVLPEQVTLLKDQNYGGTMRLGAYDAFLKNGTHASTAYGAMRDGRWHTRDHDDQTLVVKERHRHRYEVNPEYVSAFENNGVVFSGKTKDGILMEIMELPKSSHPFFIATQFHPEFTGSLLHPHPLFTAFLKASGEKR